jgi:hypothetical protein
MDSSFFWDSLYIFFYMKYKINKTLKVPKKKFCETFLLSLAEGIQGDSNLLSLKS